MDSIGDNVMAIICVVVGILIIGCALVPIVENASEETIDTTHTETASGYNTTQNTVLLGPLESITITADGTSTTINGSSFTFQQTKNMTLRTQIGGEIALFIYTNNTIAIGSSFSTSGNQVSLTSGTIMFDGATLTVTGTTTGSVPYTQTESVSELYTNYSNLAGVGDTEIYALLNSPFILGPGQKCVSQDGQIVYVAGNGTVPDGLTITENENNSYGVTVGSGSWYGPYEWTTTYTVGGIVTQENEYAALYNMIPVLCILGMAYVLIRRFY